jgi:hypothetical protein
VRSVDSGGGLYRAPRSDVVHDQGGFRTRFDFPGRALPGHDDHGYGPLATVVESFMDPGTLIRMHRHRDEEILSWVPEGVMRHDDHEGNDLVTDAEHMLVMNAGSGFRHEELTREDDPPLRMLQLFVRPHSLGLEPAIQHEPLPDAVAGEWRHLAGPEDDDAPLSVRNEARLYDLRIGTGASVDLPTAPGWDAYVYVFEGGVEVDGVALAETESALVTDDRVATLTASEPSVVVAFLVDPEAPVTRQGTVGR